MQKPIAATTASARLQQIEPSAEFKKKVITALLAIASFCLVYILLIAAAVILAIICVYAGGFVIALHPSFLTLSLGLGLIALAGSVLFFLIKFIFASTKNYNPSRVEISETEQPMLFAFIRDLTTETGTRFPKKIFLSPDVNACVFYNSSFWSMLFPAKKNLEIGIGLVNSVNVSEFKAIMAHEFGHFSQKSMKLGSLTYNVNKVIYNILFENSGYTDFLSAWAKIGNVLAIFASITAAIARGIQGILREMYKVVNKSYMGLSREMEFHADAVAASVSGGNNMISALARIEVASGCYDTALNKAGEWLKENRVAKNVFSNQLTVYKGVAKEHNLPLQNGLPAINARFIERFSKSRINYKDQWASHPSFTDRKANVEALNMHSDTDETSAWSLFNNATALQEQMTANLYRSITLEKDKVEEYDAQYFDNWFKNENDRYNLPLLYKSYYDKRYIAIENWDLNALCTMKNTATIDGIFSEENCQLHATITNRLNDIDIVTAIKEKRIDISSFDFDGVKYAAADADTVMAQLQDEVKELESNLIALDKDAFVYFFSNSLDKKETILNAYRLLQKNSIAIQESNDSFAKLHEKVSPLYQSGNSRDFIVSTIATLKEYHEPKLKNIVQGILNDDMLRNYLKDDVKKRLRLFIDSNYKYFSDAGFYNDELDELNYVLNMATSLLNNKKFDLYKQALIVQLPNN